MILLAERPWQPSRLNTHPMMQARPPLWCHHASYRIYHPSSALACAAAVILGRCLPP